MKSVFVLRRVVVAAVLACLGLAVAAFVAPAAASADPYPPTGGCSLSSNQQISGGGSITIIGSGFPDNGTVHLGVHSGNVSLGTVRAGADGSFTDTVTIPTSVTGTHHQVVASSGGVTCSFSPFAGANANVGGASVHQGVDSIHAGTSGTASTGFHTLTASLLAVVLLGGGLLFVLLGRRRRE